MTEFVNTFPLEEHDRMLFPMERSKYYDQIIEYHRQWKEPQRSVEVVQVLLFNEVWELIIQKRSSTKRHNPNLLDKSIGGHIRVGDTPDHTVMVETVQEMEVPSFVIHNRNEFLDKFSVLKEYIQTIALIRYVDCNVHVFSQLIQWEQVKVPKKYHLYMGVYGWSTRTIDREAKGILRYSMEEVDYELKKYPDMFTNDFQYFMNHYRKDIDAFIEDIKKF